MTTFFSITNSSHTTVQCSNKILLEYCKIYSIIFQYFSTISIVVYLFFYQYELYYLYYFNYSFHKILLYYCIFIISILDTSTMNKINNLRRCHIICTVSRYEEKQNRIVKKSCFQNRTKIFCSLFDTPHFSHLPHLPSPTVTYILLFL